MIMTAHKMHNKLGQLWRRRRSLRARACAVIGVFALSLQIIIPLGQAMAFGAVDDGGKAAPVILCELLSGAAKSPFDDSKKHDPYGSLASCLVCQIRNLGQSLVLASQVELPKPLAFASVIMTAPLYQAVSLSGESLKQPRAPPLSV